MADRRDAIHQEFTRIAGTVAGTLGIFAQHVETGERIEYHSGSRFSMASAFKVPVAVFILSMVESGQLSLDQMIEVRQSDISPGSGVIQGLLDQPGLILSLRNLIALTLIISDNTASDVLLRLAGGPAVVTQFLQHHGIHDIRIDRFTKHLVADKYGLSTPGLKENWSIEQYNQLFEQLTPEKEKASALLFAEDGRDTMTPAAMVALLLKVNSTEMLSSKSRDLLFSVMQSCLTGTGAIKGMLPPGVVVAHKTGTFAGVAANDVGIIYLPEDAGHIAIAVSVKSPDAISESSSACQRAIAHSARAIYDYFLFR